MIASFPELMELPAMQMTRYAKDRKKSRPKERVLPKLLPESKRVVSSKRHEKVLGCYYCSGSGEVFGIPCPNCRGKGKVFLNSKGIG